MTTIFLLLLSFGGGATVGSAAAAFLTILKVIPRLVQISNTKNYIKLYEYILAVGFFIFSLAYFTEFNLSLNKYVAIPTGFIYGMFIGVFSSALAEVLNVVPVMAKKFKMKDTVMYIIHTFMISRVLGSIFYWIYIK